MAIRANTLKKKPIASQPNTAVPRNPFLNETIVQAIEQTTLMNSTNNQLAGSIKAIENNRFWIDEIMPPNLCKNREIDHIVEDLRRIVAEAALAQFAGLGFSVIARSAATRQSRRFAVI